MPLSAHYAPPIDVDEQQIRCQFNDLPRVRDCMAIASVSLVTLLRPVVDDSQINYVSYSEAWCFPVAKSKDIAQSTTS